MVPKSGGTSRSSSLGPVCPRIRKKFDSEPGTKKVQLVFQSETGGFQSQNIVGFKVGDQIVTRLGETSRSSSPEPVSSKARKKLH